MKKFMYPNLDNLRQVLPYTSTKKRPRYAGKNREEKIKKAEKKIPLGKQVEASRSRLLQPQLSSKHHSAETHLDGMGRWWRRSRLGGPDPVRGGDRPVERWTTDR